jgi:hypothetical protein
MQQRVRCWVRAPFLLHRGKGLGDRRQNGLAQVYTNALTLSMLLRLENRRADAGHAFPEQPAGEGGKADCHCVKYTHASHEMSTHVYDVYHVYHVLSGAGAGGGGRAARGGSAQDEHGSRGTGRLSTR